MKASKLTQQQAASILLERKAARDSLEVFASRVPVPGSPSEDSDETARIPLIETEQAEHHKIILRAIQRCMETRHGRLMILAPPGSAKSTYASVVAPTWYLGREKNRRVILASYGDALAKKMGRRTRQLLREDETIGILQTELSKESRAIDEFSLTNGSEYIACGILTGVTGNRAHGIIIDDPVKGRQAADSLATQKQTYEAYEDDLKTRLIPGGWVVMILTRWNEEDLAGKILPKDWSGESGDIECRDGNVWTVLCFQAECQRPETDPLSRESGEMLWPEWFDDRHWAQFRLNRRTWSSLYQQVPAPAEGILFLKNDMIEYDVKEVPEDLRIIGAGDCAVTPDGGDWTEFGIAGIAPDGAIWLLDWWRGQVDSSIWVEKQVDMIVEWSPLCWYAETGIIRRAMEMTIRRRMAQRRAHCRLEYLPAVSNKEVNAGPAINLSGSGKIFYPRRAWVGELQRQMLVFPAGSPDDGVDTLGLLGRGAAKLGGKRKPVSSEQKSKLKLLKGGFDLSIAQNSTSWMGN